MLVVVCKATTRRVEFGQPLCSSGFSAPLVSSRFPSNRHLLLQKSLRLGAAVVIHAPGMMDAPDAHAASRRPARRRRILLTVTNEYPLGQTDFENACRSLGQLLLFESGGRITAG